MHTVTSFTMFSTYPMVCQTECLDSCVRVDLRSNKPRQSAAGRLPRFCNAVSKAAVARWLISEFVISQPGKQNVNMIHYSFFGAHAGCSDKHNSHAVLNDSSFFSSPAEVKSAVLA